MRELVPLPPGQHESADFPRFGITRFAKRFPRQIDKIEIQVAGAVSTPITIDTSICGLPRTDQESDFHCVTTWSRRGVRWSGYRFRDIYESIIAPNARPEPDATYVILRGQDGARTSLPLDDLLADDVLVADMLNGNPLTVDHGAPIRIIAPRHYGYKSVKHLSRIEFWQDDSHFRPSAFRFMDHPRARVELEERGIGYSGWLLRYLYRPLIRPTVKRFRAAAIKHNEKTGREI